jgi:hypothetical protein
MHIHTETDIAAPPSKVWAILTDLAAYARWNPLLSKARGIPAVGETIRFELSLGGPVKMPTSAEVLVADENRELRWIGPAAPRVLRKVVSGEHYFVLDGSRPGHTHLAHGEEFRGLVVPSRGGVLRNVLTPRYEALTAAIKARAELS